MIIGQIMHTNPIYNEEDSSEYHAQVQDTLIHNFFQSQPYNVSHYVTPIKLS